VGGIYLFALSPWGGEAHSSGQQKDTTNQMLANAYAQFNVMAQPYNKAATLRNSASAELTSYPSAASSTSLSSSTIDEQTGNLSYLRGMGKGDESLSNSPNASGCQNYTISGSGGGQSGSFSLPPCPVYTADPNDFITGTNGILFTFPTDYTTQNQAVQAALGVFQAVAAAVIVPILVLIGMNVMTGAITTRFAQGVEAFTRFVPAVAAIAVIPSLVTFLFNVEGALTQAMMGAFGGTDISTVLLPISSWLPTLQLFLGLGIGILIAKSFTPLLVEVIGTGVTFGVFIAVAFEAILYGVMVAEIPMLILVFFGMALAIQLLMRLVLINLYIILSPLAIVAAALPGRQGVGFTREWIMGFLALVFSQMAQVIALFLGLLVVSTINQKGADSTGMLAELAKYGTLTLMMRVPSVFRSNATSLLSGIGSSAAGVVAAPYLAFM
jgi:hypothetical protein